MNKPVHILQRNKPVHILQNRQQNHSENNPQEHSQNNPQVDSQRNLKGHSQNNPQEDSQRNLKVLSQKKPQEDSQRNLKGLSQKKPQEDSQRNLKELSQKKPQEDSQRNLKGHSRQKPQGDSQSNPQEDSQRNLKGHSQKKAQGNSNKKAEYLRRKQEKSIGADDLKFSYYLTKAKARSLACGYLEGSLRISPKNYLDAYVNLSNGEPDIYIGGILNRNAALDGDLVVVNLLNQCQWRVLTGDIIEFLEHDEAFAERFLKTSDESLYYQWSDDKNKANEVFSDALNVCDIKADTVEHKASKKNEKRNKTKKTLSKDSPWSKLSNVSEEENPLDLVPLMKKIKDCKIVGSPLEQKGGNFANLKALHTEVFHKVEQQCQKEGKQDLISGYNLEAKFNDCLEKHNAGADNIDPKKTLANFTLIQVIAINNLLSIDNVIKFPELKMFMQKCGKIVHITESVHSRRAVGTFKKLEHLKQTLAIFSPIDSRIPRMKIALDRLPHNLQHGDGFQNNLFLLKIFKWVQPEFAIGDFVETVGESNSFETEKKALLLEHCVDSGEFTAEEMKSFRRKKGALNKMDLEGRKDLRDICIFTIDPYNAKDLDDAVSCVLLKNGNLQIGVHIADVSHYIRPGSNIDNRASSRSTTYYATDQIVPMLPLELGETTCSLDAGKDRLTISILWEMTRKADIISEWIGKCVIRSCCKLNYDNVQLIIEDKTNLIKEVQPHENANRGITRFQIHNSIIELNKISKCLREKRAINGALRLDQQKYGVHLNDESMLPEGIAHYVNKESNRLIEEYMLLANIRVASKIYETFPKLSVLRMHPRPHVIPLELTRKFLLQNGVFIDTSSSASIATSLDKYRGDDEASTGKFLAIVYMLSKTMKNALYFCSGIKTDEEQFHHYALNEEIYTHFTSPIRRYPDIMVHRILSSVINVHKYPVPELIPCKLQQHAIIANTQKRSAKKLQEASAELHLAKYLQKEGHREESGVVVAVLNRAFDVLLLKYSIVKRCYCDKLPLSNVKYDGSIKPGSLLLTWSSNGKVDIPIQKISLFKVLKFCVEGVSHKLKVTLMNE